MGWQKANKIVDTTQMRGWVTLCCDVNWDAYGGTWAKLGQDGAWYVLQFDNQHEACRAEEGLSKYSCQVKRLDLSDLTGKDIQSALESCGSVDDELDSEETKVLRRLDACISYGFGAPLEDFVGDSYPERVRARARRYAIEMMRNKSKLDKRLDRPVNAVGTNARDFGVGNIWGNGTPEPVTQFGTLSPDGELTNVRSIKQADLRKCRFTILMADHYREDGSCKCDDSEHRKRMIKEWEYSVSDFQGIPLRSES